MATKPPPRPPRVGSNLALARTLWQEQRYRHDLFWRLFFRAVLAVLTLVAVPILYPDRLEGFAAGKSLIVFPALAVTVALIADRILSAELAILRGVMIAYRRLVDIELERFELRDAYDVGGRNIGNFTRWSFLSATLFISI